MHDEPLDLHKMFWNNPPPPLSPPEHGKTKKFYDLDPNGFFQSFREDRGASLKAPSEA